MEENYWNDLIYEWNLEMALKWTGLEWDLHLMNDGNEERNK